MTRRTTRIPSRRSAGDVIAGIGAVLALAGLLLGVPFALMRVSMAIFESPFPVILPSLTSEIGATEVIAILMVIVWLAWLQWASCVLVEVYAGIRRVGMPARVPLSGAPQALAHRLVSAALLLFTASAVIAPIVKTAFPATPPVVATETVNTQRPAAAPAVQKSRDGAERGAQGLDTTMDTKKVYVVQPPEGRHHESLWEIADKCLGNGRRYTEIYELNKHKTQPDGTRLHIADLIRPGWVLDMPKDAVNVHVVPADQGRKKTLKEHKDAPPEMDGKSKTEPDKPDKADIGDVGGKTGKTGETGETGETDKPDNTDNTDKPGESDKTPDEPAPAVPSDKAQPSENPQAQPERQPLPEREPAAEREVPPGAQDKPQPEPQDKEPRAEGPAAADETAVTLPDFALVASLTAAGLLAILGRRRREQLWHRAFGRRIARPEGAAAGAETALRLCADTAGAHMLDVGLRHLVKDGRLGGQGGTGAAGKSPADKNTNVPTKPTVYGAHLSPRGLDLWVHPPDHSPPAPWTAHDQGRVWRLSAAEGKRLAEAPETPAPYPGLVSIGTAHDGRIMVDLAAAHGVINIAGGRAREALAGVALELATNRWSDHMNLVLVGFGEELATIAPERIRSVATLSEALPELEERAAGAASALNPVISGRSAAELPTYLLCAERPTAGELSRLALIAKTGARLASGYVVATEEKIEENTSWIWEITEDGHARIEVLGFDVQAQLLPADQYTGVIDLFRTAARRDGDPLPEQRPIQIFEGVPSAEIRVLGSIEVIAPGRLEEARLPLATEIAVYLGAHPEGVHPTVLTSAIWPRGGQPEVRDTALRRARDWLGKDSAGRPNLITDESGRLRLGPEVRVDWHLFQEFVRRAHGETEDVHLDRALELVRGPLLAGRPAGRYAWLAASDLEYDVTARVADAAHRLCDMRLSEGDAAGAVAAVRAGLLLAIEDETLWRDLLRATAETGDDVRLRAVVDAVQRRSASHPYGGGMAPETEALIEELLPSWRLQVVNGP